MYFCGAIFSLKVAPFIMETEDQEISPTLLADRPRTMMVFYSSPVILILAIKSSGLFGRFKEMEERV
jgi:hypothetical protein